MCDYFVVFKVVCMMKFFKCLVKGVEIINILFFDVCFEMNKCLLVEDYFLVDEENEKKFNINFGMFVGCVCVNKGKFLWNVLIYCIVDIKNGVENFKVIVEVNGVIFKIYRVRSGMMIKLMMVEEDGGVDLDLVYLLSGIMLGEKVLWFKFEEMVVKGYCELRVVNGDWLLDVVMR